MTGWAGLLIWLAFLPLGSRDIVCCPFIVLQWLIVVIVSGVICINVFCLSWLLDWPLPFNRLWMFSIHVCPQSVPGPARGVTNVTSVLNIQVDFAVSYHGVLQPV